MEKKNKELMNATVILSAVSLGLNLLGVIILLALFAGAYMLSAEQLSGFAEVIAYVGFGRVFTGLITVVILSSSVLKIVTLIFAVKSRRENSQGYVLTAAILNGLGLFSGDVLGISASICGFILYSDMSNENQICGEVQEEQKQYNDNIYGMK